MNWLYEVQVTHIRSGPVRHTLAHRSYQWYVDLDDLPRLPAGLRWLARFEAADHLGDAGVSIRANVASFLAERGVVQPLGSITMLAHARSAGYVFNPLTLFWCHDPAGRVIAVVAEVQNTYRERHRYLLRPDEHGRAEVEKTFRVSPFYPVDGYYRMSVPEPGERLAVTITLHRPHDKPFVASLRGTRKPATIRNVIAVAARDPASTLRVRAGILRHGVTLYLKGLSVVRPEPDPPVERRQADRLAELVRAVAGVDTPLRIRAVDGSEAGPPDGPVLVVRSRTALRRLLWDPTELGLARAYVTGELDVDGDLADGLRRVDALVRSPRPDRNRLTPRKRAAVAATALRLGVVGPRPRPPQSEIRLTGRSHTKARDRGVIAHHYDLSNAFCQLVLDETMSYSCAYYADDGQSLVDAQRAKLDRICRKLDLQPGGRLLDVGCGWGALVLHAAEHFGVNATGVTLSEAQHDFAAKRVADRGLGDRVTLRLEDYRDIRLDAAYDAVSSIEMGEHVGAESYPRFAAALNGHLRPGGRLLLQQMSRRAGTSPGGGPYIETYIAPDMHMRPLPETLGLLEAAGLEIMGVEGLRRHYVRTAQHWLERLESGWTDVVQLLGEERARVWRLYLVGGAQSFASGRMGVDQVLAGKPGDGAPTGR